MVATPSRLRHGARARDRIGGVRRGARAVAGAATEEELFDRLGVAVLPAGAARAARCGRLPPRLVELAHDSRRPPLPYDVVGRQGTVHEMALAAQERGYEYLAICDHSPNVRVVPGLDAEQLLRQAEEIAQVNELVAPFRVLRGVECDIRADGSLDVDDRVLESLEWVQLSLHAGQRRSRRELTRMVTEAMRHPPSARSAIRRADPEPPARERARPRRGVRVVALETGVALEVNGLPDRLDLSAAHVREALAAGVQLVLNSDAHSSAGSTTSSLARRRARAAHDAPRRQLPPARGGGFASARVGHEAFHDNRIDPRRRARPGSDPGAAEPDARPGRPGAASRARAADPDEPV